MRDPATTSDSMLDVRRLTPWSATPCSRMDIDELDGAQDSTHGSDIALRQLEVLYHLGDIIQETVPTPLVDEFSHHAVVDGAPLRPSQTCMDQQSAAISPQLRPVLDILAVKDRPRPRLLRSQCLHAFTIPRRMVDQMLEATATRLRAIPRP